MAFVLILSPVMAFAQSTEDQKLDYLALGDSLAAGQTPDKQLGKGYTDYLANQLNKIDRLASFDKRFSVPGYTTTNLLNDLQTNVIKPGIDGNTVDIHSSIQKAELITMDIGANDLLQQIIDPTTGSIKVDVDQQKLIAALTGVGENLVNILTQIKTLNPNADVYLMGYYNPFPYASVETKAQLTILLNQLNQTIENAGKPFSVTFVPTANSFAVNGTALLPNPQDIHPNEAGYLTLANQFWKTINVKNNTDFNDKIPGWAKEEVNYLAERGIINGYDNGDFGAEDLITRVHSAIMLDRAIVYSDVAAPNPSYLDVTETTYGYEVIARLTEQGIFSGDGQSFYPDRSLTRAEMAKIIVEAFQLTGSSTHSFSDISGHWGAESISILSENHITQGYVDGTFKPDQLITRAEFSTMLARALNDRFKE